MGKLKRPLDSLAAIEGVLLLRGGKEGKGRVGRSGRKGREREKRGGGGKEGIKGREMCP